MTIEQSVRCACASRWSAASANYLQEQPAAIPPGAGQPGGGDEFSEMRQLLRAAAEGGAGRANREFARYERMPPMSPEAR